ncbi:MAG: hypothetical protein NXI17_09110 [Alphaproteobacteria bacterium]|nr:hypothetical protein [Alphaproteobacteria bacterium]
MFKKITMPPLLAAVFTISALSFPASVATAQQSSFQAKCAVTSGTNGGQKYATLKCHKVSEPGNYKIRTTVWESKDKAGYKDLARMSGRRFTCTMVWGGANSSRETIHTTYDITGCHR